LRKHLSTFIGLQHGQSSIDAVNAETGKIAKLAASRSAQTRRKLRMRAG
jgi:hypothetical protein